MTTPPATASPLPAAIQYLTTAPTARTDFGTSRLADRALLDTQIADLLDELAVQLFARDSAYLQAGQTMVTTAATVRTRAKKLASDAAANDPCTCKHATDAHTDHGCWRDLPDGGNVCQCGHKTGYPTTTSRQYARTRVGL